MGSDLRSLAKSLGFNSDLQSYIIGINGLDHSGSGDTGHFEITFLKRFQHEECCIHGGWLHCQGD